MFYVHFLERLDKTLINLNRPYIVEKGDSVRFSRYISLLLVSLFVSSILFSHVVANDYGLNGDELTSNKIIDDGTIISPNNPIVLYTSWPNLAVKERIGYRSTGFGFEILNTSNPETIEVLNEFRFEGYSNSSGYLVLNDTLLYLSVANYGNWSMGFYVFDVTNHENTSISQYFFNTSLSGFYCYGLYLKGNYLYFLVNKPNIPIGGVIVVDCTNTTQPVEVGSYFYTGCWFHELAFNNNYAYILTDDFYCEQPEAGIQILDVGNVSSLTKVGEVFEVGIYKAIECSGNYLYLTKGYSGLDIFDLTNPINPQNISNYVESDEYFRDVCLHENLAFLVKTEGCSVLDLSDIHLPKRIGNFKYTKEIGGFSFGLIEDDLLYLHRTSENFNRMLFILDISNPEKPVMLYPSWIAPKWVRNDISLFFVSVAFSILGIGIIAVSITLIVRRRKRVR